MSLVTFVIPVRHPENAKDWGALKARLADTIASLLAQDCDDWSCVIVANRGADLPTLPHHFCVEWVDFPPNPAHERRPDLDEQVFFDAVRLDKGRRVLAGMLRARSSGYLMVVDDDDFISRRLVAHVKAHAGAHGWRVEHGYMWGEGEPLLMRLDRFHTICGTSLVIRTDHYELPDSADQVPADRVRTTFGSHYRTHSILQERGAPLEPLPFVGAIYRVGQQGSHSKLPSVLGHIFNRQVLQQPRRLWYRLKSLRPLTAQVRREFFGRGH